MLMANTTQTSVMAMSMGHSSSAYSLLVVMPSGSVSAADTMILPAPEVDPAQHVAEHAGLAQALQAVVDAREHAVAHEREDHRVGVQRAHAPEGGEGQAQVGGREVDLHRGQQPDQHAHDANRLLQCSRRPLRRAAQRVPSSARATTLTELIGISTAHMRGDSSPRMANQRPTAL
jgi:hypothetical protein